MTQALAGLLVGRTLAHRYRIEELIGRGGMSVVYRAHDERLRRGVAVKVISLPAASEAEHRNLRDRLRREAAAAARVPPHPNVMQVYDFGTDTELDLDFIVMELLQGRDLKVILSGTPPSYQESCRIIRESARGLAAGHRAGIVHRDVKPANILVISGDAESTGIPAGTVKLLDFGIARILSELEDDELTRAGHTPQSPAYASPEQRRHAQVITAASDVYQLGLVAYEMLSGERSTEGRPGSGARWLSVPEAVRRVVERALQNDPADRYPDGTAFAEAFARAVERAGAPVAELSDPQQTPAPGSPAGRMELDDPTVFLDEQPRRRPAGKRRSMQLVALVITLLLVVLAVRGFQQFGPEPSRSPALATDLNALEMEFRELSEQAVEVVNDRGVEFDLP